MRARSTVLIGIVLLLTACRGATVTTPVPPTQAPSPTAANTPTAPSTPTAAKTSAQPNVQVQVLAMELDTPWAIDFAPDGRIFLSERPGRIRIIQDGRLQPEPWLTLDVVEAGESGLLGLALDPQFGQNRFVYAAYTYRAGDGRLVNRLVRLREDPVTGKGSVDKVLLDGALGASLHDGGRIHFGPDGKLYWTLGDAQNPDLAQNTTSLNGKILRLNSDGSVPADNPLPNLPVYAYGLRNSQGLAWQPGSGRLYATDHGPSSANFCCLDEVNLIEAGKNYGWPIVAGDELREGLVPPVISSGTTETWAPAGAAFATRGPWAGSMLFAGLRSQTLFRLILDPADPRRPLGLERYLVGQYGRLRNVTEGPDGHLYVLTSNRDGRGNPAPEDDRVLKLTISP